MNIYTSISLKKYISDCLNPNWKNRGCFQTLMAYLQDQDDTSICCLYGLQKTGKRVMMLQAIRELGEEHCLLIACNRDEKGCTNERMYQVMEAIKNHPQCEYVFVYEAAAMDGFVDVSSVFAEMPRKIVLAGTDSLALFFAGNDELYKKVCFIHTTYISNREYQALLGGDHRSYIERGGILADEDLFESAERLKGYVRTAIGYNIAHTFEAWKQGRNFARYFRGFESADQLADFVCEVISVYNRKFLFDVIKKELESYGQDTKTLVEDIQCVLFYDMKETPFYEQPFYKLWYDRIDIVTGYLQHLDVLYPLPETGSSGQNGFCMTQPGICCHQAMEWTGMLMKSDIFAAYSAAEKEMLQKRIEDGICTTLSEEMDMVSVHFVQSS